MEEKRKPKWIILQLSKHKYYNNSKNKYCCGKPGLEEGAPAHGKWLDWIIFKASSKTAMEEQ